MSSKSATTLLLTASLLLAPSAFADVCPPTQGHSIVKCNGKTALGIASGELYSLASPSSEPLCIGAATGAGLEPQIVPCPTSSTSGTISLVGSLSAQKINSGSFCIQKQRRLTMGLLYYAAYEPCPDAPDWEFQNGQFMSTDGTNTCLATGHSPSYAGDTVVLEMCDASAARQIFLPAQFPLSIQSALADASGNFSLSVNAPITDQGIQLEDFDVSQAQTFFLPYARASSPITTTLAATDCIDITTGQALQINPSVYGQWVSTFPCEGNINQTFQWFLAGSYSENGRTVPAFNVEAIGLPPAGGPAAQTTQCLDSTGNVAQQGAPLESWTCNGGPNQLWGMTLLLAP